MKLLIYLIFILFILIIYTVVSTIIKLSLFLTTKYKYENYRLFLPTISTILVWSVLAFSLNCIVKNSINMSLSSLVFNHIIKIVNINDYISTLLLVFILHLVICIILQAFTYFLANIDIKRGWDYLRFSIKVFFINIFANIKKIFTKNTNPNNTDINNLASQNINRKNKKSQISVIEPLENLNFINALISSLLSTSLIVIFIIGLFLWGTSLSLKILEH